MTVKKNIALAFTIAMFPYLGGLFAQQTGKTSSDIPEEMPYFEGCDHLHKNLEEKRSCSNNNLITFIASNLRYPEKAVATGTEGTVLVRLTIDESGFVSRSKLIRDIGSGCGEEALRVVSLMPPWEPALEKGNPTSVQLNLPIKFKLKDLQNETAALYRLSWGALKGKRINRSELKDNKHTPMTVRDANGNLIKIYESTFILIKGKKVKTAKSKGSFLTKGMRKIIRKAKKGGTLILRATILPQSTFVDLERSFEVIK